MFHAEMLNKYLKTSKCWIYTIVRKDIKLRILCLRWTNSNSGHQLPSWYWRTHKKLKQKSVPNNETEKQPMQALSAWLLPKKKYMWIYSWNRHLPKSPANPHWWLKVSRHRLWVTTPQTLCSFHESAMSFWHKMPALSPGRSVTSPATPAGNQIAARYGKNEDSNFEPERRGEKIER